jgi:hypothetical protein
MTQTRQDRMELHAHTLADAAGAACLILRRIADAARQAQHDQDTARRAARRRGEPLPPDGPPLVPISPEDQDHIAATLDAARAALREFHAACGIEADQDRLQQLLART